MTLQLLASLFTSVFQTLLPLEVPQTFLDTILLLSCEMQCCKNLCNSIMHLSTLSELVFYNVSDIRSSIFSCESFHNLQNGDITLLTSTAHKCQMKQF